MLFVVATKSALTDTKLWRHNSDIVAPHQSSTCGEIILTISVVHPSRNKFSGVVVPKPATDVADQTISSGMIVSKAIPTCIIDNLKHFLALFLSNFSRLIGTSAISFTDLNNVGGNLVFFFLCNVSANCISFTSTKAAQFDEGFNDLLLINQITKTVRKKVIHFLGRVLICNMCKDLITIRFTRRPNTCGYQSHISNALGLKCLNRICRKLRFHLEDSLWKIADILPHLLIIPVHCVIAWIWDASKLTCVTNNGNCLQSKEVILDQTSIMNRIHVVNQNVFAVLIHHTIFIDQVDWRDDHTSRVNSLLFADILQTFVVVEDVRIFLCGCIRVGVVFFLDAVNTFQRIRTEFAVIFTVIAQPVVCQCRTNIDDNILV